MKLLIISLLQLTLSAFKYEQSTPGKCPYKPGEIKAPQIDTSTLNGVWLNIFDRKELNEHLKCYSVWFHGNNADPEHKPDMFIYNQMSADTDGILRVREGM